MDVDMDMDAGGDGMGRGRACLRYVPYLTLLYWIGVRCVRGLQATGYRLQATGYRLPLWVWIWVAPRMDENVDPGVWDCVLGTMSSFNRHFCKILIFGR